MGPRVISKVSHFDFNRESFYQDERMRFMIVKATSSTKGYAIFKAFMKKICGENINIALLCCDGSLDCLTNGIDMDREKLLILENFKDYIEWDDNLSFSGDQLERLSSFKGFLIVYSLTTLIIRQNIDDVYKVFHKLINNNPDLQILALVYSDVHSSTENQILDSLVTSVVSITEENRFSLAIATKNKAFGLVQYEYKLSPDLIFENISVLQKEFGKSQTRKPDPTKNLTFNLNLNDDEKEARSQLQLPYIKSENIGVTTQDLEDDLFEEEDPDDDLDFLEAI